MLLIILIYNNCFSSHLTSKDLLNKGVDCWNECGSTQGQCSFCGDGLCCRKTGFWWSDTSNGCDGSIGGGDYHACVAAPGAPGINLDIL